MRFNVRQLFLWITCCTVVLGTAAIIHRELKKPSERERLLSELRTVFRQFHESASNSPGMVKFSRGLNTYVELPGSSGWLIDSVHVPLKVETKTFDDLHVNAQIVAALFLDKPIHKFHSTWEDIEVFPRAQIQDTDGLERRICATGAFGKAELLAREFQLFSDNNKRVAICSTWWTESGWSSPTTSRKIHHYGLFLRIDLAASFDDMDDREQIDAALIEAATVVLDNYDALGTSLADVLVDR